MGRKGKRREKKRRERARQPAGKAAPATAPRQQTLEQLRQAGMRAFKAGRYGDAIGAWEKLDPSRADVARALAEAYFRQGMASGLGAASLPYLERAAQLLPADPIHHYYLGLALHKQGRLAEAVDAYQRALANGLPPQRAGRVMALAALELDPRADLAAVPGLTPMDLQSLEPTAILLRGSFRPEQASSLLGRLAGLLQLGRPAPAQAVLSGLQLLSAGRLSEARQALGRIGDKRLTPMADAVRWYYAGVASARAEELGPAIDAWKEALHLEPDLIGLQENLRAAIAQQFAAKEEAGDWQGAARAALEGLKSLTGDGTLSDLALAALDRVARDAAQAGDWAPAARRWEEARRVLGQVRGGGTPRPVLHNLALAYEALEQWQDAAEAWRAMLRTRPRKKADGGFSEAHWAWVRRHVIDLYRRTGQPGEAIAVFRQALKANPDDADMHLGLVQALLANEQEQAAAGELQRLLGRYPGHVPALTTLAELHGRRGEWYAAESAMRRAIDAEPGDPQLRRRLADVLMERADQATEWRQYPQARALLEEVLRLVPDGYRAYFGLARVEFNARQEASARRYLERGLESGRGQPEAYQEASVAWIVQGNADQARTVVARGEAEAVLPPSFYVHVGLVALIETAPPPEMPDVAALYERAPRRPRRPPAVTEVGTLGRELLERAIAMGPEVPVLRAIITELGLSRAQIALPYAQRLAERTPDDPAAWMLLGLFYGIERQVKEAKDALRQAGRLARRQGEHELADAADALRQNVEDPFFSLMLRMAPMFEEAEEEFA